MGINLQLEPDALRPLVEELVSELLARREEASALLDGKLAYSEPEAARLLSLRPHQLRDERYRGNIQASQVAGRRIRYSREDLLNYLTRRRWRNGRNGQREDS
jgi:hypothetical protein